MTYSPSPSTSPSASSRGKVQFNTNDKYTSVVSSKFQPQALKTQKQATDSYTAMTVRKKSTVTAPSIQITPLRPMKETLANTATNYSDTTYTTRSTAWSNEELHIYDNFADTTPPTSFSIKEISNITDNSHTNDPLTPSTFLSDGTLFGTTNNYTGIANSGITTTSASVQPRSGNIERDRAPAKSRTPSTPSSESSDNMDRTKTTSLITSALQKTRVRGTVINTDIANGIRDSASPNTTGRIFNLVNAPFNTVCLSNHISISPPFNTFFPSNHISISPPFNTFCLSNHISISPPFNTVCLSNHISISPPFNTFFPSNHISISPPFNTVCLSNHISISPFNTVCLSNHISISPPFNTVCLSHHISISPPFNTFCLSNHISISSPSNQHSLSIQSPLFSRVCLYFFTTEQKATLDVQLF